MAKVLIVEDNEKNLKLFKLIIESIGCETLLAENGEKGVLMAKEQIPDLILMDIQMPVMDGITALKALLSDERTKDLPVIALTSFAMKGDKELFLEEGFTSCILKPISKDSFIEAVKKALEKQDE